MAKPLRHAMHVDVSVAREHVEARLEAALAAGGRIVEDADAPVAWDPRRPRRQPCVHRCLARWVRPACSWLIGNSRFRISAGRVHADSYRASKPDVAIWRGEYFVWTTIGVIQGLLIGVVGMQARDPAAEAAFREFVAARSPALQRTAYLLVGDWGLAEDLVQTALVKTYLAWRRLDGLGAIEPYARTVLVHTASRWWRRRWRGERPTAALPDRPVADDADAAAERDRVWRLVLTLPARQRAVLVLRFYEDLTEAQTARVLDVSVGTVKSHTARALAALRQRLAGPAALDPTPEGSRP